MEAAHAFFLLEVVWPSQSSPRYPFGHLCVVPGFLKYLEEQSVSLPRWLTVEAMGCVNVSGLVSGKSTSNKRETWDGHGHVERRRLGSASRSIIHSHATVEAVVYACA